MIKRQAIKSCCKNSELVFITSKPVRRYQLEAFRQAGYQTPEYFEKAGMFYINTPDKTLIATAAFGTTNVQVKCNAADCQQKLSIFEQVLDKITLL